MTEQDQTPNSGPSSKQEQARIVQTRGQDWSKRIFAFSVLFLSLLAVVYYQFWATGMYISSASFAVKGGQSTEAPGQESFLSQGSELTAQDSYVVENYIRSRDMLQILEDKFDLYQHYQNPEADFISRLDPQASPEDFHAYWQKVVEVTFEATTGILELKIRAFNPEMAQQLAAEILEQSEKFINDMHLKPHQDTLELARTELSRAEDRLSDSRLKIHEFQIQHGELSPEQTAESRLQMISQLEAEQAQAQAELRALSTYKKDSSQEVRNLRYRIAGLEAQIEHERNKLISGGEVQELSSMIKDYKQLLMEEQFAEKQYQQALAAMESARVMLEKKAGYVIPIQDPNLPQEPGYPQRAKASLLAVCAIVLGMGIVFLIIAAVREHSGV